MTHDFRIRAVVLASTAVSTLAVALAATQPPTPVSVVSPASDLFDVSEQSILDLQSAQAEGRVSSRGLVDAYLGRVTAYDQAGPRLNAIVTINPRAREQADALDRERATRGPRGPLHGIPVLVKDNYDTADMPTSGGTLALATLQPDTDAYQVKRLRDAGRDPRQDHDA
jgi:amidase